MFFDAALRQLFLTSLKTCTCVGLGGTVRPMMAIAKYPVQYISAEHDIGITMY